MSEEGNYPVTEHPGLTADALRELLSRNDVDIAGDLRIELISGGRSNLTFDVRDDAHHWVARRPPMGGLTPSAHDMEREWAVTSALAGTAVPVAGTVAIDRSGDVIGAPCTVVDFVEGPVVRSVDDLAALTDEQVTSGAHALVQALADLHAVDYQAVGLGDFGRPEGFAARQVRLWARQWSIVKDCELPDLDKLVGILSDRVPESAGAAIVHGDLRIDNAILKPDDPGAVAAVVDWELSALGDPITDIALMCVYREPVFSTVLGFDAAWTSDRYPSADELAQRYAEASGADLGDWEFYMGLAYLKLGVIAAGISHRAREGGESGGSGAELAGEATATFISRGLEAVS